MKTKKKAKTETIRMYVTEDYCLLYFIQNGEEIGYIGLNLYNDAILVSDCPYPEEWHQEFRKFAGEL